MSRQLLILRHAKSAWDTGSPSDFERPLAKRGIREAPRVGYWMKAHDLHPGYVVSSPALRAKQTTCMVARELNIPENKIHWDERIYKADVPLLLRVISACPALVDTLLLVGHNPGLENLLVFLCGERIAKPAEGKHFPTAALAQLKLSGDWDCLEAEAQAGQLISLIRPKDIKKRK
ncbi:SixA phosphatase family protein [Nitrosococcus wardiae]|uniref:Histidine phosphatase family protein n=1 Tax=Nitrosococcus wardiae TaxID=1814290 RepID=A0A4P7C342_9GAMM|nr:histidine phosphatase family protein [Nitrosococcus wardiae]QBQ56130.1 histidine phosphatase family protein [Nitrosococcus wardiae]